MPTALGFVSNGQKYLVRPGFNSEREVILPDGDTVQLFCEVLRPQNVPLFQCTCPDKSVNVITTPTQAANSALETLGVKTKKRWSFFFLGFLRKDIISRLSIEYQDECRATIQQSNRNNDLCTCTTSTIGQEATCSIAQRSGKLVNWHGIKTIGENVPDLHGTDRSSLWFYGSGDKVVPLQPGYDARQLINSNDTSYEISCRIIKSLYNTPIFQCEVFLDGKMWLNKI